MVYVFLAPGFEESEALVPVDILRRAGAEVITVGIGGKMVTGSHGIKVNADIDATETGDNFDMIILPGGPGTKNLEKSHEVQHALDVAVKKGFLIAAICAAPSILGHRGMLHGKKAVCYPGYENELEGALVQSSQVCEDGLIITGNGPGASYAFGLAVAARLCGQDKADKVKNGMLIV